MSKESVPKADPSWVEAELQDSFDEELELEFDDNRRIAREVGDIARLQHKSQIDRRIYFHELFRLQAELVKMPRHLDVWRGKRDSWINSQSGEGPR